MYQVVHRVLVGKRYIRGLNRLNRTAFCGLLTLSVLSLSVIFPITNHKDNAEATVTPSTTTLTLSTSDISAEITPNSASGTFVASDPATISITTNNYSGYTLGITSSDNIDNTKLINTDDDSIYLTSISSASTSADFNVGNWGYLPSKLNSVANTSYQPAPTTTATTLEATNTANANANEYTITLGAKTDYTLPSGTYENTFTLTAVANPVGYTISYNKNTTGTVENMPADQSGNVGSSDITLSNNIPTRSGYTFTGWCDTTPTNSSNADSCSGTTYQPGDIVNTNKTTTNNTALYAMWTATFDSVFSANNKTKITVSGNQYYKLQDMADTICQAIATNQHSQLVDTRDNTIYNVAKLPDNRCWFLDNLALDLTNSTVLNNMTSLNTNASNTSLYYLRNGGGSTSDQYATAGVVNWTSGNSYSAPLVNMDSKNVVPGNAPTNSYGDNKVGGYYNYCATSAGSYCYGDGTNAGTSFGNATEDICPAGWRLPTSSTGEYGALANATYGSTGNTSNTTAVADFRTALSATLSGSFNNGAVADQGGYSYFWASTRYDNIYARILYIIGTGTVSPSNSYRRLNGASIRCIADRPATISDLKYVQDFADLSDANLTSVKNSMTLNQAYQLTDNRDNTVYHIAKLADGNVWFLDNLALDLTDSAVKSVLSPVNTNASTTSLNYLINGGGTTSDRYAVTGVASWTTQSKRYSEPLVDMTNKDVIPSDAPVNGQGNNKVGGYYNFCATSAGAYCYGNGANEGTSFGTATEDICPAGWRLPTGTSAGEYGAIANAIYGSTGGISNTTAAANFRTALSIPLSGDFDNGSAVSQNVYGHFWSSTRYHNTSMDVLYVAVTGVAPADYGGRSYGRSIRCIANNSRNISNFTSMQDFASLSYGESKRLKASMDINTAYLRTDSRDSTSYHIAKLADGNVWMLDNLALDLTNSTVKSTLSSVNTNASDTSISYLKNGGGTTSDRYATAGVANWTSSYSYSAPLVNLTSKNTIPQNAPVSGAGYNKVGGYYNFCAASAGSYCYGDGTSYGTPSGNSTEDICPAGWRLPTSNTTGEYSALANAIYGSTENTSDATATANYRNALSLPLSGYFYSGTVSDQGSLGRFWASTRSNDWGLYYLYIDASKVNPSSSSYRTLGNSIRCIHAY